jgi:hypothetical protein
LVFCQNAPENISKQAIFGLKQLDSTLKQGDDSVKQTIFRLKQLIRHNDLRRILRNIIDLRDIIMISDLRTKKTRLADVIASELATKQSP